MLHINIHKHEMNSRLAGLNSAVDREEVNSHSVRSNTIYRQEVKARRAERYKRIKAFLFNAGVEAGAWLLSVGFVTGIVLLIRSFF